MKISGKNNIDARPLTGEFSTTTLVELTPGKMGRVPSNVVFLVDASSSMGGHKWSMVKQAVGELIESLRNEDRVSLVLFGSTAKEVFPLASLAENRGAMRDAVTKLENPSGVTNLEQGLQVAYKVFANRSDADKVKRVNHILLLTDGYPTDNQGYRVEKFDKYEKIVRNHENITLTGVGIGSADDYDSTFISNLSEIGRGSYYHAANLEKFKEGLRQEIAKLQSSVVGELTLKFTGIKGKVMRVAKVAPEIVLYDMASGKGAFEIATGSMTSDTTSFLVTTNTEGKWSAGDAVPLFSIEADYDGEVTERVDVAAKASADESELTQVDGDVLKASQALQIHLNGELIQESIATGDVAKATRLIDNTSRISANLGQDKVTRALTKLAQDIRAGKSVSNELATVQDEAKKTKLLIG